MGLKTTMARWLGRPPAPSREPTEARAVTEFAIIDGQQIFGDGAGPSGYRGGMSVPGAWRAATLLSDLLGSVPWYALRTRAGTTETVDPAPPLLEQPGPPDTRMTTFSSWALDLIWEGNAIGVIAARDRDGWPTAVVPVPARQVAVRRIQRGTPSPLPVGTIEYSVGALSFGIHEVIHIKGPCEPGALRGLGVLEAHLHDTLELAAEQSRQARSLSKHGVPTGVLRSTNPDATQKHLMDMKAGWLKAQRERTIAALNATTEFQPLSWNPEELQLVEARRHTLTDLELIFGLPVGWLGGMNSARQYSNIEQDAVNLLKFTLGGHLARFEQALSLHLPRGTQAKANLDSLLRSDTLSRYQAHQIALTQGFLTVDEVRGLEDLAPLPDEETPEPPEPSEEDTTDE